MLRPPSSSLGATKRSARGREPLTYKQRVALAGDVYRMFADGLEHNPISPEFWHRWRATTNAALNGNTRQALLILPSPEDNRVASLEKYFGALTDAILSRRGFVTDRKSRIELMKEVGKAMAE